MFIWDNHGCITLKTDDTYLPELERYKNAGFNVVSLNVGYADRSLGEHLQLLSFLREWIAKRPESYTLVSSVKDVRRAEVEGKLGIIFDVEGMVPVQDNTSFVQTFYELGVRWMLIAYNKNNNAGGGCMDDDQGLSDTGRAIIDEMERVGMVLCLSHTGVRTVSEALEYAQNPPVFSHSNPYGKTAHTRNVPDALLKACAAKGGVIGLSGIGAFLGTKEHLVDSLLGHLRYVIDLVGPEHVGLGLDFVFDTEDFDRDVQSNPSLYPPDLAEGLKMVRPEDIDAVVEGLARENLSDAQIQGIMGENWLRIADRVWK